MRYRGCHVASPALASGPLCTSRWCSCATAQRQAACTAHGQMHCTWQHPPPVLEQTTMHDHSMGMPISDCNGQAGSRARVRDVAGQRRRLQRATCAGHMAERQQPGRVCAAPALVHTGTVARELSRGTKDTRKCTKCFVCCCSIRPRGQHTCIASSPHSVRSPGMQGTFSERGGHSQNTATMLEAMA